MSPSPDPILFSRDAELGTQHTFQHSPFIIHHFDCIDSTQRRARAELECGTPMHGVVLWAGRQSAGHGRTGRAWSSEPGGIYVTACLPEGEIAPGHLGWLTMMAALSCAEQIELRFDLRPSIKWPNDLLIDGRKVAGFIGDAINGNYLLGMGLNWSNPAPTVDIPAASLMDFFDHERLDSQFPSRNPHSPEFDFLVAWLDRLACRHRELVADPAVAAERMRADLEARLWRRGQAVRLERTEIGPVEGVLIGLGPGGSAIVRQNPGKPPLHVYCGNAVGS